MAQEMVRVRMLRTIDQCPIVLELVKDQIYTIPRANAEALPEGVLEIVTEKPSRLEAAALPAAARRG